MDPIALAVCAMLLLQQSAVSADSSWRIVASSKQEAQRMTCNLKSALDGDENRVRQMFDDFKAFYGKTYMNEFQVYATFKANLKQISTINYDNTLTYWASGNQFSDLSFDDFKSQYLMDATVAATITHSATATTSTVSAAGSSRRRLRQAAPAEVDWRSVGKVTAVRDQGSCGSSWAFAATSAIESAYLIGKPKTNMQTLELSEQQLTSCVNSASGPYQSQACKGGSSLEAFKYVAARNQTTAALYPYTSGSGTSSSCQTGLLTATTVGQVVRLASSGPGQITPNSESQLMLAVSHQPVAFYFAADSTWQHYAGGVYRSNMCGTGVNHAMALIGYSTSSVLGRHWLAKNSWNTTWGENGFARIGMTGDGAGTCGMQQYAYTPGALFSKTLDDGASSNGGSGSLPSPPTPPSPPSPSPPHPPPPSPSPPSSSPPPRSPALPTIAPNPLPPGNPAPAYFSCQIRLAQFSPWGNGPYQATMNMFIKNTGTGVVAAPWTITLLNPGYKSVSGFWGLTSATATTGAVIGTQRSQNLYPNNQEVNVGFNLVSTSFNMMPTASIVNGQLCTITYGSN